MKVMVTGSDGQLGSALVRELGDIAFPVPRSALDITDSKAVRHFFQFERPDIIINCAAYTNVNKAEFRGMEDCYAVNTTGVANLLRAAHGPLFIQISTDYVFDGRRSDPYTERSTPSPLNIYGKSKKMAEDLLRGYGNYYIIRTSGLFAVGHRNFVTNILSQAKAGKVIKAVKDQFAHLTYVPHLARAISSLIQNQPRVGVYNIAGRNINSWFEYAKKIALLGGYDIEIQPVSASEFGGARRPAQTALSMEKYENTFCWQMPTWENGLRSFFEDARNT